MMPQFNVDPSWEGFFETQWKEPYFQQLTQELIKERAGPSPIYPPKDLVFNAFKQTPLDQVKVVIIGQDPYHGPGQAEGLCFSVPDGIRPPPSLKNIFKELESDIGQSCLETGSLLSWAKQGVLLLNTSLTVRQSEPLSHAKIGWETFTDQVLKLLWMGERPLVFLLWGSFAQNKMSEARSGLTDAAHTLIKSAHPSPFSAHRGFLGSRPFSKTNEQLIAWGQKPIDWLSIAKVEAQV